MSGMAEVLTAHQRDHGKRTLHEHCSCGWFGRVLGGDFTAHQAAMLTAAGFGPVKEAGAAALEEAADDASTAAPDDPTNRAASEWLRARAAKIRANVA